MFIRRLMGVRERASEIEREHLLLGASITVELPPHTA